MKINPRLVGFTLAGMMLAGCAGQPGVAQNSDYGQPQWPGSGAGSGTVSAASQLGLINILMGQLGINQQQALGGVGTLFALAQQRMTAPNFSKLSSAVPGMNQYLGAAVPLQQGVGAAGALGSLGALAGGQGNSLLGLASLAGAFQSLGMNSSMIGQFVPVILQYVQTQGGDATMGLLQNALYR